MASAPAPYKRSDYTVGWICAVEPEIQAARAALDIEHPKLASIPGDDNIYLLGSIGSHNVVIAWLPAGIYGSNAAATAAANLNRSFGNLRFGLMVGIGGGAPHFPESADEPSNDVRQGDVVVGIPQGSSPAVIQYDMGKINEGQTRLTRVGTLNNPPRLLLNAVQGLKIQLKDHPDLHTRQTKALLNELSSELQHEFAYQGSEHDVLYKSKYKHENNKSSCADCDQSQHVLRPPRDSPAIHFGVIASGNQVVKDSETRDYWRDKESVLCFEMEAAGLDDFKCLVIRGICDYADSHKNKRWQPYASLTASAYAKILLLQIPPLEIEHTVQSSQVLFGPSHSGNVHWLVPRISNPYFTGREDMLSTLTEAFKQDTSSPSAIQKRLVITGYGGMGKSETCIKFAELCREQFWGIFWINAGDIPLDGESPVHIQNKVPSAAAKRDFLNVAKACGIHTEEFDDVKRWLSNINHNWLLIIDNADNNNVDYGQYFPTGTRGNIILTSRNPECSSLQTVGHIAIENLNQAAAEDLVLQSAGIPRHAWEDTRKDAAAVVAAVGCHTLALLQAGAFIQQKSCAISEYPEQLKSKRHSMLSGFSSQIQSPYGDVYSTFEVAITYLESSREEKFMDALELLPLCAFLDNTNIPETMMRRASEYGASLRTRTVSRCSAISNSSASSDKKLNSKRRWLRVFRNWASKSKSHPASQEDPWSMASLDESIEQNLPDLVRADRNNVLDNSRWRNACAVLSSLSIVKIQAEYDEYSISIHPLIHDWLLYRQQSSLRLVNWSSACSLVALSTKGDINWNPFMKTVHPHILATMVLNFEEYIRVLHLPSIQQELYVFSCTLIQMHDDKSATRAVEMMRFINGVIDSYAIDKYLHIDHLSSILYTAEGNYEKAKNLLECVRDSRSGLQYNDPQLLDVLNGLVVVNVALGRYEEAIKMAQNMVKIRLASRTADDADVLNFQGLLAFVYTHSHQLEQALEILQKIVAKNELPSTRSRAEKMDNMFDLADVYYRLHMYDEALKSIQEVVAFDQTEYGPQDGCRQQSEELLQDIQEAKAKQLSEVD